MNFNYQNGELHCEAVALSELARDHGTPCYVYSQNELRRAWQAYSRALSGRKASVCYAVKANGNIALLKLLADWGAGFDIVSGGELERVLAAGVAPDKVLFSGVGKSDEEIRLALSLGVRALHVESAQELDRIAAIATTLHKPAPLALRVNPDLAVDTHAYIGTGKADSKFGVSPTEALELYRRAAAHQWLTPVGISAHLGSQIFSHDVYQRLAQSLLALYSQLKEAGIKLDYLDIGGGLGVAYQQQPGLQPEQVLTPVLEQLKATGLELVLEPGRSLVATSAVLLSRVLYTKRAGSTNYAVVDAAMNDLLRPALYSAWHDVQMVAERSGVASQSYDIVGPVCESGDFLAKGRELALAPGDLVAIRDCGAYVSSMASNYNSRNRSCELLVDGDAARLIKRRESYQRQLELELGLD